MSRIRFGEFDLDGQTFELRRNGEPIRIQQQPARVLAFLFSHRGSLVTREQIRAAVWGEDTFVDFEQGLNFCIRQIRRALGDEAGKPKFIETLPRLGYRFITQADGDGPAEKHIDRGRIRIGVAPVADLSGRSEDYFAAGLTEDMISALSRIDPARLRVTAVPQPADGVVPGDQLDELQRNLALDYLLRGSVRRSADTIRISAQLHDLKDKCILWSESYNRKSADLLAVQEDVTLRVSRSLALELLPGTSAGSRKYSRSSAAYDAYLKGRFFWHKMTKDGIHSSMRYFNEALSIDPSFAPAHAGLADCYAQMGSIRTGMMKPFQALEKARLHLQHALQLDETLAEAHCTQGLIKSWYDLDWQGAEREFQIALNLDPSQITALLWQSLYLAAVGRNEEAVDSVRRAMESEPLSLSVNLYLGVALTHAGQYDLSIRQLQQTIEMDPSYYRTRFFLGRVLTWVKRYDDAIASYEAALERNPESMEALGFLAVTLATKGEHERARQIAERVKAAQEWMEPSILLATIYAALGDESAVFEWLQAAVDRKSVPIYIATICREYEPYRSDRRFRNFLDQVGLSHLG